MALDGDAVRLAQVFANLLNNAAKYTDPGGQIWLEARRGDREVVVSVRDTGVGIPADMLPRVFDMFTQVDRSAGRTHGGLGIGLTLVERLLAMHDGRIEARSEGPGRGSEFIVRLPLAAGPLPARDPEAEAPRVAAGRRIMVVDDNRDAADSLGELLRTLGADVCVAHSGAEALRALTAARPAVVLLDLGMPTMDGYEVARRIRARPEGRDVVLIALTGWGQEDDRRRSREAGFDHHLIKPADLQALQTALAASAPAAC
jgi:CheY-like chemotaxis protein/anti-sigma regulatory factor (Ser/Thr protein kinase)